MNRGRKSALGLVEVKCLGVCPQNAVIAVNVAHPGEWLLVREGAAIEAVIKISVSEASSVTSRPRG